jgi:hypothetical protein
MFIPILEFEASLPLSPKYFVMIQFHLGHAFIPFAVFKESLIYGGCLQLGYPSKKSIM